MKISNTFYLVVFVFVLGCNTVPPGPINMEETVKFFDYEPSNSVWVDTYTGTKYDFRESLSGVKYFTTCHPNHNHKFDSRHPREGTWEITNTGTIELIFYNKIYSHLEDSLELRFFCQDSIEVVKGLIPHGNRKRFVLRRFYEWKNK